MPKRTIQMRQPWVLKSRLSKLNFRQFTIRIPYFRGSELHPQIPRINFVWYELKSLKPENFRIQN